jgi:CRP-like cAMP-binding protein
MFNFGESIILSAFIIGLISAAALPIGAITSFYWRPDQRVIASLMAFGGGSLLAALTLDLVASAVAHGQFNVMAIGALLGGILFILLDALVGNYGGYRRKLTTLVNHRHLSNTKHIKNMLSHLCSKEALKELEPAIIESLSKQLSSRFYGKGSLIFTRGDDANELYILQRGSVKIGSSHSIDLVNKNDIFGKFSLFTGSPHLSSAQATEDCWVGIIPKDALEHLLVIAPSFRLPIQNWLLSAEVAAHLKQDKGYSESEYNDWKVSLLSSFESDCVLPDIGQVNRNSDDFITLASSITRMHWLEDLENDDINALIDYLVYKEYQAGDYLFHQGEPAQHIFIVHRGSVSLFGDADSQDKHTQLSGDVLGSRAFVCGLRHTISAKAEETTRVWTLSRDNLARLLKYQPSFCLRLNYYINEPSVSKYLQQRYSLNQSKILFWLDRASHNLKEGQLPPSLMEMGIESTEAHGAALAIWLGIMLDGIPESLVIGANMMQNTMTLSLLAGLFLSNYPEALSSSRGMRDEHLSRGKILLMWTSIMLMTGIGASIGALLLQGAEAHWFAFLEGLAAGAMLTMIAQTMLPEAYSKGGSLTGFSTLMGFLITISLKEMS